METQARDLFLEWLWFDFQLHTGHTIAEYALDRHAADVGPGASPADLSCSAGR